MELEGSSNRSRVRRRSHSPLSRRVREKLEEAPIPPRVPTKRKEKWTVAVGKSSIPSTELGGSRFRSRSWSPPSSTSRRAKGEKKIGTGRKKLYMFVSCNGPPNDHLLYEVEIPAFNYTNIGGSSLATSTSEPLVYPIHEFESRKYPISMCCAQLGSRLYFFGGSLAFWDLNEFSQNLDPTDANWYDTDTPRISEPFRYFPRVVHIYDTESSEFLSNSVPPMHSGKCHPYAFVAGAKIYVLGSNPRIKNLFRKDHKLCYFECFDPVTEVWSVLPDPISGSYVVGHVLKDNDVYILDDEENMYRFNLERCRWYKVDSLHNFNRDFIKKAVCIDDKIYAIHRVGRLECLAVYGTVFPSGPEGEAYWDSDVTFELSLIHIESNILCYVCMGYVKEDTNSIENLEITQESEEDYDGIKCYRGNATKFEVKVSIFGVPGRIYAQQTADGLGALFHVESYYDRTIIAGRKCSTDLRGVCLKDCFLFDVKE